MNGGRVNINDRWCRCSRSAGERLGAGSFLKAGLSGIVLSGQWARTRQAGGFGDRKVDF